jgi:hypothetical protein
MGAVRLSARGFATNAARMAAAPRTGVLVDFAKYASVSAVNARRALCRRADKREAHAAKEAARQANILRCIAGDVFRPALLPNERKPGHFVSNVSRVVVSP